MSDIEALSEKLHGAACLNRIEVCKQLIYEGADVNYIDKYNIGLLHIVIEYKHTDIGKLIIEHGIDVNQSYYKGYTPLHAAVYKKNYEFILMLLQHGASPNKKNIDGESPMHFAAFAGDTDICKILIQYGADPYLLGNQGITAIEWAYRGKKYTCVSAIEKYVFLVLLAQMDNLLYDHPLMDRNIWHEVMQYI